MKKSILMLLSSSFLLATPAFATVYTYSGSGFVYSNDYRRLDLQATIQIEDHLFTNIYTYTSWEPLRRAPGEPLPEGPSVFDSYIFPIYNWSVYINGMSYTGTEGIIKPWDVFWSLGDDDWVGGTAIFTPDQQVAGTLPSELLFWAHHYPGIDSSYSGYGQINLARVPEPSIAMLFLTAIMGFAWLGNKYNNKDRVQ